MLLHVEKEKKIRTYVNALFNPTRFTVDTSRFPKSIYLVSESFESNKQRESKTLRGYYLQYSILQFCNLAVFLAYCTIIIPTENAANTVQVQGSGTK